MRAREAAFRVSHRQFLVFPIFFRAKMPPGMFWLLFLVGVAWADETCLTSEDDPYLFFGAKTAYIFANRRLPNTRAHDVPGCQPKAFWLLNRHGSHNPEANEIPELQKLVDLKSNMATNHNSGIYRDLNNRMCTADFNNIIQTWAWNNRQNLTFAGDLTSDGYLSAQQLAQAWKQKFPGLLTGNRHNYLFKFGSDKRSKSTFRAFTEGLFGAEAEGFDIPKENDETLVYPYKSCPVWSRDIEENNDTLAQMHIFESKLEYREMVNNISQRLGFNYELNKQTILSLYNMCRYNKAWDVAKISPWCAAFSHEDLKRMEYAEDLVTYYKYGYGSALHSKIGCLPIKDMYNFFTNHISDEIPQQPLSMVTFTDEAMLLTTLATLNTHHDPAPLTGDNFRTNMVQARKWTTSTMAPFNGNLAAVLYKCTPNGNFQIKDEYQVLFLENEKPMYLEECRVGLCDWSLVKHRYAELVGKCSLDFCNSATRFGAGLILFISIIAGRVLV